MLKLNGTILVVFLCAGTEVALVPFNLMILDRIKLKNGILLFGSKVGSRAVLFASYSLGRGFDRGKLYNMYLIPTFKVHSSQCQIGIGILFNI